MEDTDTQLLLDLVQKQGFSSTELCVLARSYRRATESLSKNLTKGDPFALAPFRLCAIHSIELYLSTFLLAREVAKKDIRSMQHSLSVRAVQARKLGLQLRKKTHEHLITTTEDREYLIARYRPDELPKLKTQLNRLTATLIEVAEKVEANIS